MHPRVTALVRSSFHIVTQGDRGAERFTALFFRDLLGHHPEYRQLFPPSMTPVHRQFFAALTYTIAHLDDDVVCGKFLRQLGRDHRKYGVRASDFTDAADAIHSAMRAYTGALLWTSGTDAAWRSACDYIAAELAAGAGADNERTHWTGTVVEFQRVLDDLAIVRLRCPDPLPYEAGQYVPVQVPQRPRIWRYLSPAIPWNPVGEIEFHVRRVSGGWVSPAMVNETKVGDEWSFGAPLGALRVDLDSGQDVLMISCGTGLAPLRAQIMDMTVRGVNPQVHLFVGGHCPRDLYDMQTLWQIGMTNPWLTLIPVVEQQNNPWWATDRVPEMPKGIQRPLVGPIGAIVTSFGSWPNRQVQISGPRAMVETTRRSLQARGVPASAISHDPV